MPPRVSLKINPIWVIVVIIFEAVILPQAEVTLVSDRFVSIENRAARMMEIEEPVIKVQVIK
mgnify:CR=1 FL=1